MNFMWYRDDVIYLGLRLSLLITALNDSDVLEAHFPVTEITSDYLNSSSSIRDFRSRVVTVQLRLSTLRLDLNSRDKLLQLIGPERYDEESELITITTDRCPYRKQNSDYCDYLLKALYYESRNRESWESEITPFDVIDYKIQDSNDPTELKVEKIFNEGESTQSLDEYKNEIMKKFNLKNDLARDASS